MDDIAKLEQELEGSLEKVAAKNKREPTWVDNLEPDEFEPFNLLYREIFRIGFHLRFKPAATDVHEKESERLIVLHIDDPEEREKVTKITDNVSAKANFKVFRDAYQGDFRNLQISLKSAQGITDEEKKALEVLCLEKWAQFCREQGIADAAEWEKRANDIGVAAYSLELMREKIVEMVDGVLAEHPQWRP